MMIRLNELIKENSVNVSLLAKELGLKNAKMVYKWINGDNNPDINNIIKLANYFNCSVEYLLGRSEDNSQTKFKEDFNFYSTLIEIMKKREVTKYRLQKERIVYPSYFQKWEKEGIYPSIETVVKLADYLGVSVDMLLGRD